MAKYRKLGRTASQRKALIRNQVTALLANGKIVTTEAKVKEIRKVEFVKLFNKYFGNDFKLFTKQEFISSGLLGGGTPHRKVDDFIADFVAVSTSHKSLHYTTGQKELPQLKGDHAGISEYEMKIPLIFIEN